MAIQQYSVKEIVDRAVSNSFGMPEFQRGFVWTPAKVMNMVESLYQDYPIGALLLWRQPVDAIPAPARVTDAQRSEVWVVDGQQRTTALCLLFGRRPYWWKDNGADWNEECLKNDIHVNPLGPEVKFAIPTRSIRQDKNYTSVREIIRADDKKIGELVKLYYTNNPEVSEIDVLLSLQRVRGISSRQVAAFLEDRDLEDTVEIFVRLNQNGTKVSEGDIVKAQVAASNPNWVNRTLEPFLVELEDSGFDLAPTLIFRSLIAATTGHTRFKNVGSEFWSNNNLNQKWTQVAAAWRAVISGLNRHGILNSDILPSENALIPLIVLAVRFQNDFSINPALAWLLRATCTNRYSRTTDTRLAEDIRAMREGANPSEAVRAATTNLDSLDFTSDNNEYFKRSYRDGGVHLMLYLLAYANEAHDWSSSKDRIGFAGPELLQKFNPDWHHIFPRAFLRGNPAFDSVNSAANIVAIRKETNLKIGKKAPMDYMEGVSDKLLREQYVPTARSLFTIDHYDEFLEQRAKLLADAANEFMGKLEQGLTARQDEAA